MFLFWQEIAQEIATLVKVAKKTSQLPNVRFAGREGKLQQPNITVKKRQYLQQSSMVIVFNTTHPT